MTMTDPIADFLTRIRNAVMAGKDRVDVPASRLKLELTKILKEEGFIRTFKVLEEGPQGTIRLYLRYSPEGEPAIHGIERVSRPGRRVYMGVDELPSVRRGIGIAVVSTSKGLMTDARARELRVGGEVMCKVW
ncbi:MAG: 30S ribosomal protein S8 [Acidobacteriota bacterium]|uniref:Small ribosomal subunit protein uS8 n=1 Tax=Thermoanaerobaculum aquaticum TaxID=1312852 RepID=A0A062Y2L3_9BACT|nr:30S ribosomal protein S8 [Thermoanaerobaculum aquaticum]KDA54661.1 30S ribosomal protein S8 [Thermoanaerobaculum aquaticum]BCW92954.1 MAG: 30S ribosomal protein S8 [Thermoanaerobaculum sp.]GBC78940.1 30S ribosomal protein S8 [bacterium HR09]